MALVLTNGIFYIAESDNGSIEKVEEESKAKSFTAIWKEVQFWRCAENKMKKYYVFDTVTR